MFMFISITRRIMFQKDDEPRRLGFYQGLVPLHLSAEPYLLVSSPHPPLSRYYLSPTLYHHLSLLYISAIIGYEFLAIRIIIRLRHPWPWYQ